jgi:hypothetical protein
MCVSPQVPTVTLHSIPTLVCFQSSARTQIPDRNQRTEKGWCHLCAYIPDKLRRELQPECKAGTTIGAALAKS